MLHTSNHRRLAVAALAAWLACGCASRPAEPLRLAISPWPGYTPVAFALDHGLFRAAGVEVQLVETMSTGDSRRAFERGGLDGFCGAVPEVLVSREESGSAPRVVWAFDYSCGADQLLARPGLDSVGALRGRRVAFEPGTLDVVVLHHALASGGLRLEDVELVPLPQSEAAAALAAGSIDACETYPPFSADVCRMPGVRRLFDTSRAPRVVLDVLVADSASLATHPEAWARALGAIERAARALEADSAARFAYVAAREQLTVDETRAALDGVRPITPGEQARFLAPRGLVEQSLERTQALLVQCGTLAGALPVRGLVAGHTAAAAERRP